MTETICPTCRGRQSGTSGCVCETENGQIIELCCAHDEYYQHKLTKLREAYAELDKIEHNPNLVGYIRYSEVTKQITVVLQAVKEVLNE